MPVRWDERRPRAVSNVGMEAKAQDGLLDCMNRVAGCNKRPFSQMTMQNCDGLLKSQTSVTEELKRIHHAPSQTKAKRAAACGK